MTERLNAHDSQARNAAQATDAARALRCAQCGAGLTGGDESPSGPRFCCYGCALVNQIVGARAERGEPSWLLPRLGLAAFLTMNIMGLSLVLYAGDAAASPATTADAAQLGFAALFRWALLAFSAPVIALLAWPILENGIKGFGRRGTGVDTLIALGAIASFGASAWATIGGSGPVYYETACMILVLVTLGRALEAVARSRAARAMRGLLESEPMTATVLRDGGAVAVPISDVRPGEIVLVTPGSAVPVDGVILDGEGGVDESSLTGEPLPVRRRPGGTLLAGTVSVDGAFHLRATATGEERMSARIARILDEARASRAPLERLADRVASVFVPVAVVAALAASAFWTISSGANAGLLSGLAVLLIACPCALGLATPLAVWHAIGAAASRGIIIRSGEALERLASVRAIFFDKTGTLTVSPPLLSGIRVERPEDEKRALALAAGIEAISEHPLARAIVAAAAERGLPAGTARNFRVHPGVGVEGEVGLPGAPFARVAVGGPEMLRRLGVPAPAWTSPGGSDPRGSKAGCLPEVYLVEEGRVSATLSFDETLRPGAAEAITSLSHEGIVVEILSGDSPAAASRLEALIGVKVHGGLSPRDKVDAIAACESERLPVAMVGEGINDAPALARASISIALGCGADLARDASDISLLRDDLTQIPWLVRLARRTHRAIRVNLFWAFSYNVVLIPLAMAGHLQPILAALAMIGSSLLVVTNSMNAGGETSGAEARGTEREAPGNLRMAGAPAR